MDKYRNGPAPGYLAEFFTSNDPIHMHKAHNTVQLRGPEPGQPTTTAVL